MLENLSQWPNPIFIAYSTAEVYVESYPPIHNKIVIL